MFDHLYMWYQNFPVLFALLTVVVAVGGGLSAGFGAMGTLCGKDRIAGRYEFRLNYNRIVHLLCMVVLSLFVVLVYLWSTRTYVDPLVFVLSVSGFFAVSFFVVGVHLYRKTRQKRVVGTFLPTHIGAREIKIVATQEGPQLWSLHFTGDNDVWHGFIYRLCARFHLFGCVGTRKLVLGLAELLQLTRKLIEVSHELVTEAERNEERGYSLILASPLLPGREKLLNALRKKFAVPPTEEWDFHPVKRTLSSFELAVGKDTFGWKLRRGCDDILAEGVQIWHRSLPRPGPVSNDEQNVSR
ncbi:MULTISPECIES: hypothetical protein [Achromobacter]|uniref:Uncharacterized protein n=1 Tax=Achromobacter xylosoxidans (strain A8) TaxID=762376 RepID=E3HYI3_ACHXA|nr:hypothetical protein [Achromobacter xylosoxidans]ADP20137.1 hypothetical protein AXYL_06855 [Achromobacter xylosoxidans A8]